MVSPDRAARPRWRYGMTDRCCETTTWNGDILRCELYAPHPTSSHFAECDDGGALAWGEIEHPGYGAPLEGISLPISMCPDVEA